MTSRVKDLLVPSSCVTSESFAQVVVTLYGCPDNFLFVRVARAVGSSEDQAERRVILEAKHLAETLLKCDIADCEDTDDECQWDIALLGEPQTHEHRVKSVRFKRERTVYVSEQVVLLGCFCAPPKE